jgi:hypothetical protein
VGYNATKNLGIGGVPVRELILKGAERGQNIRLQWYMYTDQDTSMVL